MSSASFPVGYRRILSLATLALVTTGCSGADEPAGRYPAVPDRDGAEPGTLTVYSRDREFAEPLFDRFERATGITIRARWGDPITLADQIIDDGDDSPADVFYAPLSDALGSLSAAGRLAELSDEQLDRVPRPYRSPDDLPDSILGFTDPAWRGRLAWDPTSRSLQDVVTELGQLDGRDAARDWLDGIQLPKGIPSATELIVPGLDVRKFEKLDDARRLLTDAGILR